MYTPIKLYDGWHEQVVASQPSAGPRPSFFFPQDRCGVYEKTRKTEMFLNAVECGARGRSPRLGGWG